MEFILFISKMADSLKVPAFLRILGKILISGGQNKLCEIVLSNSSIKLSFKIMFWSILITLLLNLINGYDWFISMLVLGTGLAFSYVFNRFRKDLSKSLPPLLLSKKGDFAEMSFIILKNTKISELHSFKGKKKFDKIARDSFQQLYPLILEGYDVRTYTHTKIIKQLLRKIEEVNAANLSGFEISIIVNELELSSRKEFLEKIVNIPYRLHALTPEKGILMPFKEFWDYFKKVNWIKIPKTYEEILNQYDNLKSEGIINEIVQIEKFYEIRFKVVEKH